MITHEISFNPKTQAWEVYQKATGLMLGWFAQQSAAINYVRDLSGQQAKIAMVDELSKLLEAEATESYAPVGALDPTQEWNTKPDFLQLMEEVL